MITLRKQHRRYEMYRNTGYEHINKIPSDWSSLRLNWLFFQKKEHSQKEEELLSVYRDYGVIPKSSRDDNFNKPSEDLSNYILVHPGDLVINKMKAWQGSIAISRYRGIVSPAYFTYKQRRIIGQEICLSYLHHLLRSIPYIETYRRISNGIRPQQWDLDPYQFKLLPVVLPPLKEQERIASYLDEKCALVDDIISKKQRQIELLKEKRAAIINRAVTRGLNENVEMKESGVEWIGEVPKHWQIRRIKMLSQVKRGASPRPIDDPVYFDDDGEYSWVRIADVTDSQRYLERTTQKLSEIGKTLSVPLEPGNLIISIAGSVGKPIINKIKCCIHDGFVCLKSLQYNAELLYYIFSTGSPYQGLGKLGTQLNLNSDIIGNISLPLPNAAEQQQIVEHLDRRCAELDKALTILEHSISLLSEYKTSLISHAVTGRIRVP